MEPSGENPFSYAESFLRLLLLLAFAGLLYLFWPFLPGLCLAVLIAASTYPLFERLKARMGGRAEGAALTMTAGAFLLVVAPVVYLLLATGVRVAGAFAQAKAWFDGLSKQELLDLQNQLLAALPIPEDLQARILAELPDHLGAVAKLAEKMVGALFGGILTNAAGFVSSLILISFALFFFYRDGPGIVHQLKVLSPLKNKYDDVLIHRFAGLATVLTLSTLGIALLQGVSFALVTAFLDLPWFYLGVAIAVTSFIPVVGSFIVWGPLSYYLFLDGQPGAAVMMALWGAVVVSFVVDNMARPVLIGWLTRMQPKREGGSRGDLDALNHTLLTALSTFGGLIAFGILGLFFGPLIAAMAISVFDVYEMKHGERLDRS